MSPADLLLPNLELVKEVPAGKYAQRWLARCPAHADRNPSLAITLADDGRLLLKCYAGCGAVDVVNAVGLELKDLFPPADKNYSPFFRDRPRQKHDPLETERKILWIAAENRKAGHKLSQEDLDRELVAFLRVKAHA